MNVFKFPASAAAGGEEKYASVEPYNKNEVYSQNSEYYLAGIIVCVYLHGIIYKDQIIKLLTKCILVQSASNMKDYASKPSDDILKLIMSNDDGSKGRIDKIKHQIRHMENEKFADIFSKEQFTCTTQEVCKSLFELYRECEKYDKSKIEEDFSNICEELIDANVIDTQEMKETIKNWVDEIREAMVSIINEKLGLSGGMFGVKKPKHFIKSDRFVNRAKVEYPDRGREINRGVSGTRSRTRSIDKSIDKSRYESHQELEAQKAQQLQEQQLQEQQLQEQQLQEQQLQEQQLQEQQLQDERFIRYLREKQQYLLTEFAKNNRKYYYDGNKDLSTETPKRHLTYDGAAGLPNWSFGGRQAGEVYDRSMGLMIRSCKGSHLEFFFKDNEFNPTSKEACILRNGNTMHKLLAELGKTCFYISDDGNDESEKKRTYDELLEEMSRNYDEEPHETEMLRVCGFINYVRFLATRYYQGRHGLTWTPYLQFIHDPTTMKAYVYVFSCSKIEESMCSFTGKNLKKIPTIPPRGGSKTRRKKPRNKHSRKSRKRSNSLISKVKRKPRK